MFRIAGYFPWMSAKVCLDPDPVLSLLPQFGGVLLMVGRAR